MKIYQNAYSEMQENYRSLNHCKKIYNIISLFYAAFGILYACDALKAIVDPNIALLPLFLDGIFFKAAVLIFGYGSCYKHKSIYSVFTIIISICSIIMAACDSGMANTGIFFPLYIFPCLFYVYSPQSS